MSFVDETGESATLEAALAFIDSLEQPSAAATVFLTERALKKRPSRARAENRPRRLPVKEELEQLRRLVPEMETALDYMRNQRGLGSQLVPKQRLKRIVALEFQRRRGAEATNRHLKRILASLLDSTRASRDAVAQPIAVEDLALIYEPSQAMTAAEEALVVGLLADRLQQLKLDMASVLQRSGLNDADTRFSRQLRQVDSKLGAVVETSYCFPLGSSWELTAERFWRSFYHKLTAVDDPSVSELEGYRKTYVHDYGQSSYQIDIKMSLRKYVEADRVVVVWSSVAPMISKGVRFILDHVIVLKRAGSLTASPPTLKSGSLLQGWFRVHTERFESPATFSGDTPGVETLSDDIMNALSDQLTGCLTTLKSAFPRNNA